jgi:hypothetical protein
MKQEEIIQNNKLIAEFMTGQSKESTVFMDLNRSANDLEYHSSWDWLMPVINKIYEIPLNHGWFRIKYIIDSFYPMDIEKTYKEVVEYIEWYNENK